MASSVHTIRLRGPWTCRWFEPTQSAEQTCTVQLPVKWQDVESRRLVEPSSDGEIRLERRFHQSSGLTQGVRIWLVLEELASGALVELNGQLLETRPANRWDISAVLKRENVVSIRFARSLVTEALPDSGVLGSARLEIEESQAVTVDPAAAAIESQE
jgi:hypothetical protein